MIVPPGLLGAALLFWAQQTGLWLAAVPMILLLEGAPMIERRWDLAREDFYRIGDLCTLLFAALVVYLYLTRELTHALATVLAWLPLSCFPLLAAQRLSAQGRLDLGALFWSLRRGVPGRAARSTDISYPYFALCILSAGSANVRTPLFYGGMFVLCSWALWQFRARSRPAWVWAVLVAAAGALGYVASAGLTGLQASLEKAAMNAVFGNGETRNDPGQSRTAIGQIGRIQLSGDIALRVIAAELPPRLLRAASYNRYWNGQWFAREPVFRPVASGADGASWDLAPAARGARSILVSASWPKGEGVLPLPLDAFRIEGLRVPSLERNRLGAVRAADIPAAVSYRVDFAPGAGRDAPPVAADLENPPQERATFAALARELRLSAAKPGAAVEAAARFFTENFRYTLFQEKAGTQPLKDFLYKTRAGHCEYFATATVLLLRAGGIPARYAAGYAVQEYSPFEKAYVVRHRHAHAWALAFVDGAWRDVDTTPASWPEIERGRGSFLEPLSDRLSWARLRFSLWRVKLTESSGRGPAAWFLLLGLAAWIVWKASAVLKASRRADRERGSAAAAAGADSEFYEIETLLDRAGLGRRPWEAPAAWTERIASDLNAAAAAGLRPLLRLHYRYRFDPEGITAEERRELKAGTADWLSSAKKSS